MFSGCWHADPAHLGDNSNARAFDVTGACFSSCYSMQKMFLLYRNSIGEKKNVSQTCSGEMFSAAQLDFSFTMRWLKSLVTCAVDVLIQIFHVFRIYFPWKGDRYLTFACIYCIPFLFNSIFPSLFTSNRLRILLMVNNLLTFAGFQQSSHRTNDAFVIRLNVFCMLSFLYEFHAWNYLRN